MCDWRISLASSSRRKFSALAICPGGFNYQYLLDFLNVVGDATKIRLELKDEQSAGQLRPSIEEGLRYRYVIMPMRI